MVGYSSILLEGFFFSHLVLLYISAAYVGSRVLRCCRAAKLSVRPADAQISVPAVRDISLHSVLPCFLLYTCCIKHHKCLRDVTETVVRRAPREEELPAVAQLQGYGLGIEEAVMSLRNTEHVLAAKLAEVACADSSAQNTSSSSSNKRASSSSSSSSSSARNSSSSSTKKSRKGNRSSTAAAAAAATAAAAAQDYNEYEDYRPDCEQSSSECECGGANGYDNGNSDNGSLDIQVALALAWALEVRLLYCTLQCEYSVCYATGQHHSSSSLLCYC
jgi:hypothetical protein